jgi:RimJ/RimL family protein N-acetyltransferase
MLTPVTATERLLIRRMEETDAAFVVELVNDPAWIRYIGDNGVRTVQDAERYIRNGPVAMYVTRGFGLYLVELKESSEPIGICGLIKREGLSDVDLGFAFLQRFWGAGYALEAAAATVAFARDSLRLRRIVAITTRDNRRSSQLLRKLGFAFEDYVRPDADGAELELYALAMPANDAR